MIAKDTVVSKGQLIGYIGYDDENGDGGPHLHLGIRIGAYDVNHYEGRTTLAGLSNNMIVLVLFSADVVSSSSSRRSMSQLSGMYFMASLVAF